MKLRRFLFGLGPFAGSGKGVHPGAVGEGLAGRGEVFGFAAPDFQSIGMKCPAKGKGEPPGEIADGIHQLQMTGGIDARLAAGQEGDAGNR